LPTTPFIAYTKTIGISFDPAKRAKVLDERGLDFADATLVFDGEVATAIDDRHDYGEDRYLTAGYLNDRLVVVVWTLRGQTRRIISMRHCHADEEKFWHKRMGRSG
jgi:uncharacterized protein